MTACRSGGWGKLVSRTRCSALGAAPQSRDPGRRRRVHQSVGPGSAAHHFVLRCVRGTEMPLPLHVLLFRDLLGLIRIALDVSLDRDAYRVAICEDGLGMRVDQIPSEDARVQL